MKVRTRFAPSPTGVLHLGSVRTALFNWLYARHYNGQFILRIEDTDRERSTPENVEAITDSMTWLALDADEGPYFQSDRFARYREVIAKLLDEGNAYYCYCSKEELEKRRAEQMTRGENTRYDGRCREHSQSRNGIDPVVRFKNPLEGEVVVEDSVRGSVTFQNSELDDLIIARSDGSPTYNFAVVVDDCDMRITHVIRGDDHLNNTPRQMNMLAALGARSPAYSHLPMILGPDGAKLSKRHGAVDIREYRALGYLPEAMLNYLVRLGWSHGDQEFFTIEEMIGLFEVSGVNQSASSFNPEKLLWLNQQHIIAASPKQLGLALEPYLRDTGVDLSNGPTTEEVATGFRERAETLQIMATSARYCFEDFGEIDQKSAKKNLRPSILKPLANFRDELADLDEWTRENIARTLGKVSDRFELKLGRLGQPIRVAITGGSVSPPIDVTIWLIGLERVLFRLDRAIEFIERRKAANDS